MSQAAKQTIGWALVVAIGTAGASGGVVAFLSRQDVEAGRTDATQALMEARRAYDVANDLLKKHYDQQRDIDRLDGSVRTLEKVTQTQIGEQARTMELLGTLRAELGQMKRELERRGG